MVQHDKTNSIRICFVSLNAYPLFDKSKAGVQGGAEVDTYMIAAKLAEDKRFDVHFITGDFGQPDTIILENIKIHKTIKLKFKVRSVLSIWRALKIADCDIYFKKGASIITTIVALFCRIHHKMFILRTSHKSECDGSYINTQLIKGKAYKLALKIASQVFVQNAQDCESLSRTAGVQSIAIPNGHRITNTPDTERKWILWVGRSIAFKRPELFIKLAQEFPSEQFLMICQFSKGDQNINKPVKHENLKDNARTLPNIKFIEYVPFSEIDSYFMQAKLFINTSDTEGFPNTFIQACKCKTPILSFKVNPDDFLNSYKCGMCANGDWKTFKDMLKQMLEPENLKHYGENGQKYVITNHNIDSTIEKYKNAFFQIMHR